MLRSMPEPVLIRPAAAFDAALRSPEAQAAFRRFLSRGTR